MDIYRVVHMYGNKLLVGSVDQENTALCLMLCTMVCVQIGSFLGPPPRGGGVPCYMLYGFSMGLLYAITNIFKLL